MKLLSKICLIVALGCMVQAKELSVCIDECCDKSLSEKPNQNKAVVWHICRKQCLTETLAQPSLKATFKSALTQVVKAAGEVAVDLFQIALRGESQCV